MTLVACGWRRAFRGAALGLSLLASSAFAGETTQYTYDALGRVVSAIDASGKKVSYTYDSAGNRTRVSNGAEFAEILPTAWSSSSNAGTTGMTTTNGLRDGAYAATSTIVATNVEAGAWVKADLGSVQNVNHIDVTAAIESTTGATLADLNDTAVEYSTDGTIWATAATIEGVSPGASKSVTLGGVSLRYLRLHRLASGRVAFGDLRLYSAAAANTPLIANPDTITSTGSAVTFDPRTNDVDQDGYSITLSTVDAPVHGTAVINSGVSLTYTPNTGYTGADSFTYTVTDGHNGAASARVSVMVQSATNHTPVAVNDTFAIGDRVTSSVDGTNALRPLLNDYDADGDVLTITGTGAPAHGTVTVVGSSVINYQPTVGYDGSDSFTYNISDGRGGTASATITVTTANSPPVANTDNVTTSMNQAVKVDPRLNDTDPNGDAITVSPITQPAHGTAVLNADQTVTYTPSTGYVGGDSLTYTLTDARSATATGQININVTSNQPPVAVNDNITATASTPVNFDPRTNDSDPEHRVLTIVALTAPGHGTASIGGNGTSVTYTMGAGYSGFDSFTYTISDDQGGAASATVAVNGLAADYFIVAGGGGGAAYYGGGGGGGGVLQGSAPVALSALTVTVGAGGAGSAAANAGNGGASSLGSVASAVGGGGGGAYYLSGSIGLGQAGGSGGGGGGGSGSGGAGTSGQGFNGGASAASEPGGGGGASAAGESPASGIGRSGNGGAGINSSFNFTTTNYAAGGGGGGYTDNSSVYQYGGAAGGSSAAAGLMDDNSHPGYSAATNRGGGGGGGGWPGGSGGSGIVMVRYRGAPKATGGTITQVGGYTFHTFTASGTFTPTTSNHAPTAANDSYTVMSGLPTKLTVLSNDTDPDGDALTIVSTSTPGHGSVAIAADGQSVTYTATLGFTSSDSFTYTISDGQGLSATATVTLTIPTGQQVDYLVVGAGGGGGRGGNGGGGGGGAVLTGSFLIPSGGYAVTIGTGGAGAVPGVSSAADGGSTSLSTLISALGGGRGSDQWLVASNTGANGGGGSGGSNGTGGLSANGGHKGGSGYWVGAGGAGAGADGVSAPSSTSITGPGGVGVSSSLSGASISYAAGGGGGGVYDDSGGAHDPGAAAGDSSGGAGGYSGDASSAPANRGGGGGGGGVYVDSTDTIIQPGNGGNGGSGIVIIRYPSTAMTATGGTVTTSGGYRIHTFTSNGTFTVP